MCEPVVTGPRQRSLSRHVLADYSPARVRVCHGKVDALRRAKLGELTAIELRELADARTCPAMTVVSLGEGESTDGMRRRQSPATWHRQG